MARTEILTQAEKEFLKMSLDVVLRAKGMEMIDFVKICKDKLEALPEFVDVPDPVPEVAPSEQLRIDTLLNLSQYIKVSGNTISIQIQDGPEGESGGKNGVGIQALLDVFCIILESFDKKFPCKENVETLAFVEEALRAQKARNKDRKKRGVEGTSQA